MDKKLENLDLNELLAKVEKITGSGMPDVDQLGAIKKEVESRLPAAQLKLVRDSEKVISKATTPEEITRLKNQEMDKFKRMSETEQLKDNN